MKFAIAPLLLLTLSLSAMGQEVIVRKEIAPELPAAGKWIASDKPLRLEDMRDKVVVVHFWKTQWDPCEQNFKVFDTIAREYNPKTFQIVGIHALDLENNPEFTDIEKIALKHAKTFPTVVDDTDLNLKAWKVNTVPTTFVIDKKGKLRYAIEGQLVYRRFRGDLVLQKLVDDLMLEK